MCSTGVTAREQVAVVAAAISRFDTVAAAGVGDLELVELLEAWQRVEQMAAARKLAVLAEIREREANRLAGAATAEDLLAQRCGLTKSEAKTQAQAAAAMALPAVAEKLRNGEMTVSQAHVVGSRAAAIAETAETMDAAVAALQALDDHVATVDTTATDRTRLGRDLDAWAHRSGHDVLADRERRAHDRRYVQLQARDGGWAVNGLLPAVGGAAVKAALDAIARTHPAGDPRDWGQRQADALVSLAERYLDEGALPQVAVQRPHVLLITTPDALHDSPGAEASHLDGYGPIANDLARQVCCDADITVITQTDSGQTLNVGHLRREPNKHQRAAVIARDKTCIGCNAPVSMCQIHHIRWWRDRGRTDLANLTLVCWTCHHHIHHNGWQITRDASGRYRTGPPGAPPHPDNSIANATPLPA